MQHRVDSFMEALTNTAIGLVVAQVTLWFVNWIMGIKMSPVQQFGYISIFTFVSILRSYVIRRAFNGRTVWVAIKGKMKW